MPNHHNTEDPLRHIEHMYISPNSLTDAVQRQNVMYEALQAPQYVKAAETLQRKREKENVGIFTSLFVNGI